MKKTAVMISILIFSCGTAPEYEPVVFAIFGNTWMGDLRDYNRLSKELQSFGADFAIDLGNRLPPGIPSGGTAGLLNLIGDDIATIGIPVYPLAGLNDIFDSESSLAWNEVHGPLWYSFAKGGVLFVVLGTEDEAHNHGYGIRPNLSDEQLRWLEREMKSPERIKIVFMHRPLWEEAPSLWRGKVLPLLRRGRTALLVTGWKGGLYDWGVVDGIRAVSSGCTGETGLPGAGLFPHFLIVAVDGEKISFEVLNPDGTSSRSIGINREFDRAVEKFNAFFNFLPLRFSGELLVGSGLRLELENPFETRVEGEISFEKQQNSGWDIKPLDLVFGINRSGSHSFNVNISSVPLFGPPPRWKANYSLGGRKIAETEGRFTVEIPRPATGEPLHIDAVIPAEMPYDFDGGALRIPVNVYERDIYACFAVYDRNNRTNPACIHASGPYRLEPGINELVWNGRDIQGNIVNSGPLEYRVFLLNPKAPPVWIGESDNKLFASFQVDSSAPGERVISHDKANLLFYSMRGLKSDPRPVSAISLENGLDGFELRGFTYGKRDEVYLLTDWGIARGHIRRGRFAVDETFGNNGFFPFTSFRGREVGNISVSSGRIYAGLGGGNDKAPLLLALDSYTGKIIFVKNLEGFYGIVETAPAIASNHLGIWCVHPESGNVVHFTRDGELIWSVPVTSEFGDHNHRYGLGIDENGLSYINLPGRNLGCLVLGPDGKETAYLWSEGLHGLTGGIFIPSGVEENVQGIYCLVKGADKPYILHVPFTVKDGLIDEPPY